LVGVGASIKSINQSVSQVGIIVDVRLVFFLSLWTRRVPRKSHDEEMKALEKKKGRKKKRKKHTKVGTSRRTK
jgi:hypothetical protein